VNFTSTIREIARSWVCVLVLLVCACEAYGADTYNGTSLTIPSIQIGNATYADMVVTVGSIVSGPTGTAPNGSGDFYDPASHQLTIQAVTVGASTYYNVVMVVGQLVSIGGVSGADSYDGTQLDIADVQVLGEAEHSNVVVTVASIDYVEGGMPALARDEYTPETRQLAIPAVQAYGKVFTNVLVNVGEIVSPGGAVLAMGNGSGGSFVDGAIGIGISGTLAAGGSTGLAVTIVDQDNMNTLDAGGPVTVNFNSRCLASGEAQILPAGSTTPALSITMPQTASPRVTAFATASAKSG